MALNNDVAAEAVQVTRAAPLFDRLADHLVAQLRDSYAFEDIQDHTPQPTGMRELRERLDSFFPEFRQVYGGLLVKHLGPERAPQVLADLTNESVQLYFRALKAMEAELQAALDRLGERMVFAARLQTQRVPAVHPRHFGEIWEIES